MSGGIRVRVLGAGIPDEIVDTPAQALQRCKALAKQHPAHWIDAKPPTGRAIHIIEPSVYADYDEPESLPEPPPEQTSMF